MTRSRTTCRTSWSLKGTPRNDRLEQHELVTVPRPSAEGDIGTDLTPLTGPVKRRPFIVLDIESKDGDTQEMGMTRPFMVGVYGKIKKPEGILLPGDPVPDIEPSYEAFFDQGSDGRWDERFWQPGGCVDRAMRFILRRRFEGHYIYAHNAGRFDFLFLLPWLMNVGVGLGYRFSIIPVASSIQVLDVWKGRERESDGFIEREHVWRFLDSYRLIPTSLDKAAKAFGLQGKLKHDLNLPEDDPRWVDYNGQDCSELFDVLVRFHDYIENILMGEVGVTAPATSMKIFRRNYLKHAVPRSVSTHAFVRTGYVGGRVEPYELEAEGLRYFDINSSYPRAMLDTMPAGPAVHCDGEPPQSFRESRIGFVEADVEVPYMHIPVLPIKDKENGKLIFPYGRLSGVWEWDELQVALSEGAQIVRWGHSVWFEPVYLFKDFIESLYAYRDKNNPLFDPGLSDVAKNMMNSHYGKYGMKTLRKQLFLYDDPKRPEGAVPLSDDPESIIYVAEEEVDAAYIMPQISARVTALGRIRLWRGMKSASCPACWPLRCRCRRNEFVAYTDTDSILTPTMLQTSSALGDLKDEIPEHSGKLYGKFIGPKVYILRLELGDFPGEEPYFEKVKAKGLERSNRKKVEKLARGGVIYQQRLEKVGSLARAGFRRGPTMTRVPRRILQTEGKREIMANGHTRPFKVAMW
jgi:hypothetical protein